MKKVVSVSLGSSRRNHRVVTSFLDEEFEIQRIGTDGDMDRALALLKEMDGRVDAIGLGGIDIYLKAGNRRFALKDGLRLKEAVKKTPVVDGSGLKDTLERECVVHLEQHGLIRNGQKVLMVSGVDRFGMAEALAGAGCEMIYGDLMFALGMPYPVSTLAELEELAAKLLPELAKMPFTHLYPTGTDQEKVSDRAQKFASYYDEAEVIAGDFHFIRRYLPPSLEGKMVLTNTTTQDDIELLGQLGVSILVTTTPELEGRSFGTNVMEAVFLAILEKPWAEVTNSEYLDLIHRLGFVPNIRELQSKRF